MIPRLRRATNIHHMMSQRFFRDALVSPQLADSTIYITPLKITIEIDNTIVILSIHLAILTINGACLVVETVVSSHFPSNT